MQATATATAEWLSVRQLIFFHTVLQAHKTIISGRPADLHESISTQHPYRTRNATSGRIRFGEQFRGESSLIRAVYWNNEVPALIYRTISGSGSRRMYQLTGARWALPCLLVSLRCLLPSSILPALYWWKKSLLCKLVLSRKYTYLPSSNPRA